MFFQRDIYNYRGKKKNYFKKKHLKNKNINNKTKFIRKFLKIFFFFFFKFESLKLNN
jgi:hypothetical protein